MSNDRKPLNEGYKPTGNQDRGYRPNGFGYQPATNNPIPKPPSGGSKITPPTNNK